MEIGLQIPSFTWGEDSEIGPTLGRIAETADTAGLHSLWLMDHFFQIPGVGDHRQPMLEAYTTLGFLAARTSRIQLGTLVTGVTYRFPGILAKTVTTLDVLSGGRAWLGIGAAWNQHEHEGLGVPFPPVKERFQDLEDALRIALQMWSDDEGPYEGTHYQLAETLCSPQPVQRPAPPILIGGTGERKTLRLVAQYADAWNGSFQTVEEAVHKIDVLHRHCEAVGRDPAEIQKTVMMLVDPLADLDGFLTIAEQYARLGFDLIDVMPPVDETDPVAFVSRLGEHVIPRVTQLSVAEPSER